MTVYHDIQGVARTASTDVLVEVLRALGAPLLGPEDAPAALRARRLEVRNHLVPPVRTGVPGRPVTVPVRIPAAESSRRLEWTLHLEGGGVTGGWSRLADLSLAGGGTLEGTAREVRRLQVGEDLPAGIHRLHARVGARRGTCHLVVAPERAFGVGCEEPLWGLAHPLYGIRHAGDWGIGDFEGLRRASEFVRAAGGDVLATLPLLATFVDEPDGYPPYRPVTRLHWNEVFVDPAVAPELAASPEARAALAGLEGLRAELRARPLVGYHRVARARHAVLAPLAAEFFRGRGPASTEFRRFLASRPTVGAYARFRAARAAAAREVEAPGGPAGPPGGPIDPEALARVHVYAQWLAERQVDRAAREGGTSLLLDFPVGVHPEGFDVWRHPHLFAAGVSVGAPPDPFFSGGQEWGVPPLRPEAMRRDGYAAFREALAFSMRAAGFLRIDHVMGLHRLFWVPAGRPATDGVYVQYPAEELAAVVRLVSHRARCEVVGEDLGTVPPEVRDLMERRGFRRTFVLGFALPDEGASLPAVPEGSVAVLGTHDMAPWPSFSAGDDLAAEARRGRIPPEEVDGLRERRLRRLARLHALLPDGPAPALAMLGRSPARLVLASLDDLLGVREPQNRPGTGVEEPNWRRRLPLPLADVADEPAVRETLRALRDARRGRDEVSRRPARSPR
ncbi:MAG: 4-alpha-glucanotransferase [Gemmatimonadota bacterium]|nr:4-alpha-glucanotransferase [Gemmatimonadota bacterium]